LDKEAYYNSNKNESTASEKSLIDGCLQGNSNAFSLLVKLYRKQLYTYLYRLAGNRVTAEDLFQETLLKVWRNLKHYNEQNKFSSWLFSIAHNVAIDSIRKRKVRDKIKYLEEITEQDDSHNPHFTLEKKETTYKIMQSINKLPEKQKQVLLLRQHSKMTFKEIAELLNEPLNTVLGHMHYAVKKLRKELVDKDE
jgi:RNA polymerase sigma-70 factor (ECF subfamily)